MRAIDIHCHVGTKAGDVVVSKVDVEAVEKYMKLQQRFNRTEDEMAQDLRKAGVKALIIAWDAESVSGIPRCSNDYVAQLVKKYPDVYLGGWAMIDPWKGKMAIKELERCIKELGMIGLKFQAVGQAFYPNDRRFYPLYEKCVELRVPVQFHTGTSLIGTGEPGGGGYKLKYARPIYVDDVAADFPKLTIIACHYGWPWHDELVAMLLHKGNVYNEVSSWTPRQYPLEFKREINGRLQDKFMFGSDYPFMPIETMLRDWEEAGFKPEVLDKVFYKNAQRILGVAL